MSQQINPLEKKIIFAAVCVATGQLALVAYAALKLGIGVPTCVTNVKPFESGSFTKVADKRYEIHVVAKMWGFEPGHIVLPTGSVADLYVVSKDVTHGFHVGGTNVNLMAVPFVVNNARVKFDRPGTYPIVCHEYCGVGHQAMNGAIEVSDAEVEGHADGLATTAVAASAMPAIPEGRKIMQAKGCLGCHSLDGKPSVGPTLLGILGRREELADGRTIAVDAAYLESSIRDPQKDLVKGFGPLMPKLPMTDSEVRQTVEYLSNLR